MMPVQTYIQKQQLMPLPLPIKNPIRYEMVIILNYSKVPEQKYNSERMHLTDITAYAEKTYSVAEDFKWPKWPSFSVLSSPLNGRWVALLMYQHPNKETGEIEECCDIRCGSLKEKLIGFYGFSDGIRMKGAEWLGVTMGPQVNQKLVKDALDHAFYLINLPNETSITISPAVSDPSDRIYGSTAIPKTVSFTQEEIRDTPKQILKMMQLYDASDFSIMNKAQNFYVQGMYMKDYKDHCPWNGTLNRLLPVYHDLRIEQLRGYFTWRTLLRSGIYEKSCTAFNYLYLYEILNQIGVSSPKDGFVKLKTFYDHREELAGIDTVLEYKLKKWMPEYAVFYNLSVQEARAVMDSQTLQKEDAVSVLQDFSSHTLEELYHALSLLYQRRSDSNPLCRKDPTRAHALFGYIWTQICSAALPNRNSFIKTCFGKRSTRTWVPFSDAVFHRRIKTEDRTYPISQCRIYTVTGGNWTLALYNDNDKNRRFFQSFMHEADRQIRNLLHTGHPLKEQECEEWIRQSITEAVQSFLENEREAAKPKIHIDLSQLDHIREDAGITRERLLTDEEREAEQASAPVVFSPAEKPAESGNTLCTKQFNLTEDESELLRLLLDDQPSEAFLKAHHLMASVITDSINEKLFDEFGDSVLDCDGRTIFVIEDYRMDLTKLLKEE